MTDEQLKDYNDLVKGVYPKVALCRRLEEVMVAIQAEDSHSTRTRQSETLLAAPPSHTSPVSEEPTS